MWQRAVAAGVLSCVAACADLAPHSSAAVPPSAVGLGPRIDHVSIGVADATVSAAFYAGVFGLTELKTPFSGGLSVVWLDLGGGVALHIFGGRTTPVPDERERHIAIAVRDMSQVTTALQSRGVSWQNFDGVRGAFQTRPDGVRQMFFSDPDGYWVEVNDALDASKNERP